MELSTVTEPGTPAFDCAGYYGEICGDPVPRWRHMLRTTWNTPWNFDVSINWRYVSAVKVAAASPNPILASPYDQADYVLASRSYVDLGVDWRVNDQFELRAGVNNVFDMDPPVVGTDWQAGITANSNTYPGVYDALGRWLFVGVTARE
jgi:outer membrane receptor for ferrienterochelin and colicin